MLELMDRYPGLTSVVVTCIVWPIITGLLSLGYARMEQRFPVAVAYLRAAGLDLPRTLDAIRAAWPKRLPPPPPKSVILLLLTIGGGVLGLTHCGGSQELAKFAEAGRDIAERAEPCFVAEKQADEAACGGDSACLKIVKDTWTPIADAMDLMHQTWCQLSPKSEGCP